jgi:1-deoxyxylulose-5-phosphate synthase
MLIASADKSVQRNATTSQMPMKTNILGRTGPTVSHVALGCGTFGGVGSPSHLIGRGLDEDAAWATMDEAVALGITFFDTAHSYAGGASERFIGKWLGTQSAEARSAIRIATKVGNVVTEAGVRVDLSPPNIIAQLSQSLERLGVPRVDFCLTHDADPETPIESTLEGFAEAIESGLVSHIGASNVDAKQLTAAMQASDRLGLPRYEWIQNEYNLLNRRDERELFQLCEKYGVGYTPFSPIAGGRLSGKYVRDKPPPADSRLALRPDGPAPSHAFFAAVARLEREAARRGCSAGALALAWVMHHPRVTAAICGPARQAEHLRLVREALAIHLDEAARIEIGGWFEFGEIATA